MDGGQGATGTGAEGWGAAAAAVVRGPRLQLSLAQLRFRRPQLLSAQRTAGAPGIQQLRRESAQALASVAMGGQPPPYVFPDVLCGDRPVGSAAGAGCSGAPAHKPSDDPMSARQQLVHLLVAEEQQRARQADAVERHRQAGAARVLLGWLLPWGGRGSAQASTAPGFHVPTDVEADAGDMPAPHVMMGAATQRQAGEQLHQAPRAQPPAAQQWQHPCSQGHFEEDGSYSWHEFFETLQNIGLDPQGHLRGGPATTAGPPAIPTAQRRPGCATSSAAEAACHSSVRMATAGAVGEGNEITPLTDGTVLAGPVSSGRGPASLIAQVKDATLELTREQEEDGEATARFVGDQLHGEPSMDLGSSYGQRQRLAAGIPTLLMQQRPHALEAGWASNAASRGHNNGGSGSGSESKAGLAAPEYEAATPQVQWQRLNFEETEAPAAAAALATEPSEVLMITSDSRPASVVASPRTTLAAPEAAAALDASAPVSATPRSGHGLLKSAGADRAKSPRPGGRVCFMPELSQPATKVDDAECSLEAALAVLGAGAVNGTSVAGAARVMASEPAFHAPRRVVIGGASVAGDHGSASNVTRRTSDLSECFSWAWSEIPCHSDRLN